MCFLESSSRSLRFSALMAWSCCDWCATDSLEFLSSEANPSRLLTAMNLGCPVSFASCPLRAVARLAGTGSNLELLRLVRNGLLASGVCLMYPGWTEEPSPGAPSAGVVGFRSLQPLASGLATLMLEHKVRVLTDPGNRVDACDEHRDGGDIFGVAPSSSAQPTRRGDNSSICFEDICHNDRMVCPFECRSPVLDVEHGARTLTATGDIGTRALPASVEVGARALPTNRVTGARALPPIKLDVNL